MKNYIMYDNEGRDDNYNDDRSDSWQHDKKDYDRLVIIWMRYM